MCLKQLLALLLLVIPSLPISPNTSFAMPEEATQTADSYLEKELKTLYDELMVKLPEDAQTSLSAAQDSWITFRQNTCLTTKAIEEHQNNLKNIQTKEIEQRQQSLCMSQQTQQRIRFFSSLLKQLKIVEDSKYQPPNWKTTCQLPPLPHDSVMFGVSTHQGLEPIEIKLADSNHQVAETEVIVNYPEHPVVLVLNAYDPVVWKVKRTPESNIAAVLVIGYESQALLGVPEATPQLFLCNKGKTDCPNFKSFQFGNNLLHAVKNLYNFTGVELEYLVLEPEDGRFLVPNGDNLDWDTLIFSEE